VLGVLLAAVGSVSVGAFMPNTTRHATAQQPLQVAPRMVLADRRFLVITVAAMVGAGAVEALLVHRVARFAAAGFSVTQITFWAAVAGVLSFPGRILVPRIAASHSGFGLLVVAMAGIVLAALLAVAPSADWIMISHFVVFGLFFGAVPGLSGLVGMAILLGIAYTLSQAWLLLQSGLTPHTHAFGAVVYTLSGFHLLHVLTAIAMAAFSLVWMLKNKSVLSGELILANTALFWHYVFAMAAIFNMVVFIWPLLV
jgi:hypothetical protein